MLLTSCALVTQSQITPLTSERFTSLPDNAEIMLTRGDVEQPYVEIAVIDARAIAWSGDFTEVDKHLREKARELGGNAVINIKYEIFFIGSPASPAASAVGTVVKINDS